MSRRGRRQKLKKGHEHDIMRACRKYYCYLGKAGVVKWIKRSLNKRWRRELKVDMDEALDEYKWEEAQE